MSKNQYKKIADYEFVQNVRRVVINAPQDENYQRFSFPSSRSCDNSCVIAMKVLQALTNNVIYARGSTKKDNSKYQYYFFDNIEVFGILNEDQRFSKTDITYVVTGDQEKSKVCCKRISDTIKIAIDELSS